MSDSRGKDSSFLRKVVKFVSSPNTEWGEFDGPAQGASPAAQERSELQVMIERKRRNDFVRRQELDLLRQIRREGLTGDQIREMQRQQGFESSGYQPTEQAALPAAEVRRRIDGIEREMSYEDTAAHTRSLPLAAAAKPVADRPSTVGLHETTQHAVSHDPTLPAGLRRLGAQVTIPKIDLEFDTAPGPVGPSTVSRLAAPSAPIGTEPGGVARWHPVLEFETQESELAHDPELDQAVMAFANADFAGCEKMLRALVAAGGIRQRHAPTWRALLDLYRAIGQQQRFEWTCAQFEKELGETPPTWVSIPRLAMNMEGRSAGSAAPAMPGSEGTGVRPAEPAAQGPASGPEASPAWRSPSRLDAAAINALRVHVSTHAHGTKDPALVDWSPLQMLDAEAAQALRTLLRDWTAVATPQRWLGLDALFDLLDIAAPPGDHLADPVFWQVRLESLRLLGVRSPYDLAAEDFAATYGSSPPEWYHAATVVIISDSALAHMASSKPDFAVSTRPDELGLEANVMVELVGQLAGDVSATMSRALLEIGDATTVTVACDRLIRVDLMAAGELLNWVGARRAEGRRVRLTQVHRLIALFLCAMGLDDQASIELRSL